MVIAIKLTPDQYKLAKRAIKQLDNAYSLELRKTVLKIHTDFNSWSLTAAKFYEKLANCFPTAEGDHLLAQLDWLLVEFELSLINNDYGLFPNGSGWAIKHLDDVLPF